MAFRKNTPHSSKDSQASHCWVIFCVTQGKFLFCTTRLFSKTKRAHCTRTLLFCVQTFVHLLPLTGAMHEDSTHLLIFTFPAYKSWPAGK